MEFAGFKFIPEPISDRRLVSIQSLGSRKECSGAEHVCDHCQSNPEFHKHVAVITTHDANSIDIDSVTDFSQVAECAKGEEPLQAYDENWALARVRETIFFLFLEL